MNGSPGAMDRLPFTLPEFTRCSWVGEGARLTWEPRFDRIRRAWSDVEWLSIVHKVRSCALVGLTQSMLSTAERRWSASELSALRLPINLRVTHPGIIFLVVGSREDAIRAREAWIARADDALGLLFGYPECCRKFFREVWTDRRCLDTTWAMATKTVVPQNKLVVLESSGAQLANILWRWLGVRAVPHLPCRFDCGETTQFGERLLWVAEQAGFTDEVNWIKELLSWPVEWSALHGIAEVKTPILRLSTRTDATASKYVIRWTGTSYPQGGATGLRFPYRAPARLMTMEQSQSPTKIS